MSPVNAELDYAARLDAFKAGRPIDDRQEIAYHQGYRDGCEAGLSYALAFLVRSSRDMLSMGRKVYLWHCQRKGGTRVIDISRKLRISKQACSNGIIDLESESINVRQKLTTTSESHTTVR